MHQLHAALIDFFILNLFLTLVSLPIMVAWGLPLSWLSPIGNFIFSPFLSLFLLTSTLSFFCELLGIPHGIFNTLLEYIAYSWQYLLNLAPHNSSFGCTQTAFYLLLIISIATFALFMLPSLRSAQKQLTVLTILFFCALSILKIAQPNQLHTELTCKNKKIEIIRTKQQTTLIDHGAFSEQTNPASWVQYHFIPDLIKATGSLSTEHLILPRPTIRVLEATIALMQHASVKTIYYPSINGEMTGSHRGIFRKWYAIAKSLGVMLIRVQHKTAIIIDDIHLTLAPGERIQYRGISFDSLKVCYPSIQDQNYLE